MWKAQTYAYTIPVNEPDDKGSGTVTVLRVQITDNNPVRRCAVLRKILKQNYGLRRKESKRALRAMGFDDLVI